MNNKFNNQSGYIDNELILKGNDLSSDAQRIIKEIEKFDLDAFLHSRRDSTGAVGLITKNQMILTDTFIRSKVLPNYGSHIDAISLIYKAIYGPTPPIITTEDPKELYNWQEMITKDGNILIQFCEPLYMISVIWLPDDISSKQLSYLENLNEEIKQIINKEPEYFREKQVIFAYTFQDEYIELKNNLDNLIYKIKENRNKKRIKNARH